MTCGRVKYDGSIEYKRSTYIRKGENGIMGSWRLYPLSGVFFDKLDTYALSWLLKVISDQ